MLRLGNRFTEDRFIKSGIDTGHLFTIIGVNNIISDDRYGIICDHVTYDTVLIRCYYKSQKLWLFIHCNNCTLNLDASNDNCWYIDQSGYVYGKICKITNEIILQYIRNIINNCPIWSPEYKYGYIETMHITRCQLTNQTSTGTYIITKDGYIGISMGSKNTINEILNLDSVVISDSDYLGNPYITSEKKLLSFYNLTLNSSPKFLN